MVAKTKKKPPPKKAPKKKGKKKNVVLFIPEPGQQERRRTGLDSRKRVLAWPCLGRSAGRSALSPTRIAPLLRAVWRKKLRAGAATSPVVSEDGVLYVA